MRVTVRPMLPADARSFLEVHRAAVHQLEPLYYPPTVVQDWAPLPITDDAVQRFLFNPDQEVRLVAESSGEIVGIGAI